jgi:hypothetical protein
VTVCRPSVDLGPEGDQRRAEIMDYAVVLGGLQTHGGLSNRYTIPVPPSIADLTFHPHPDYQSALEASYLDSQANRTEDQIVDRAVLESQVFPGMRQRGLGSQCGNPRCGPCSQSGYSQRR